MIIVFSFAQHSRENDDNLRRRDGIRYFCVIFRYWRWPRHLFRVKFSKVTQHNVNTNNTNPAFSLLRIFGDAVNHTTNHIRKLSRKTYQLYDYLNWNCLTWLTSIDCLRLLHETQRETSFLEYNSFGIKSILGVFDLFWQRGKSQRKNDRIFFALLDYPGYNKCFVRKRKTGTRSYSILQSTILLEYKLEYMKHFRF